MGTLSILKTLSAVAAVSAVAITATTVKASAITINLGGSTQLNPGAITDPSGIGLTSTASATARQSNNSVISSNVLRNGDGLGIVTDLTNSPSSDNDRVDGLGAIETLTLAFNQAVSLTTVSFSGVRGILSDSFTFLNGGNPVLTNQSISSINGTYTYNFASPQTGTSFGFQGGQLTSAFYVSSLNVEAVPEPITIAGMVMGSGFGALLFRKYNKGVKFSTKLRS